MRVSSISFKGLWRGPLTNVKAGNDPRCKHGDVYRQSYEYLPFKDETEQQIIDTAMKFNSTIYAYNDKSDDDAYGPESYFIPAVLIGDKLNITAEEYQKISGLKPAIFETNHIDEYVPMKKEDALELLGFINKE